MNEGESRFRFELQLLAAGCTSIAGVDEAGRGPLAGPVVAAAVVLPTAWIQGGLPQPLRGLNDSKQLSPARRAAFCEFLLAHPEVRSGIAAIEAGEIDTLNILRATHRAMGFALAALNPVPDHALIDGLPVPSLPLRHTALVKGDARSLSIAAASVLAKVTRDRRMVEFDRAYPGYGFAQHKGYGTAEHLAALERLGPSPIHRRSFAPLNRRQGELFP